MSGLPKGVEEALTEAVTAVDAACRKALGITETYVARDRIDALRSAILAALAAARAEAVEEAARVCDERADHYAMLEVHGLAMRPAPAATERMRASGDCAVSIRSILPAPKQGDNERERA